MILAKQRFGSLQNCLTAETGPPVGYDCKRWRLRFSAALRGQLRVSFQAALTLALVGTVAATDHQSSITDYRLLFTDYCLRAYRASVTTASEEQEMMFLFLFARLGFGCLFRFALE
jgi:hypothetical protein